MYLLIQIIDRLFYSSSKWSLSRSAQQKIDQSVLELRVKTHTEELQNAYARRHC